MSEINRARGDKKDAGKLLERQYAYLDAYLGAGVRQLCAFQIAAYTAEDEAVYASLSPGIKRRGAQDCRIAAQGKRNGWTVVTDNASDFPPAGVQCVDWTREEESA